MQLKVIEIQRQFGADVFVRMLFGLNDPLSIHMGGLNVSQQTDRWEVRTEEFHRGNTTAWQSTIRTPDGTLTQEFSRSEIRPGTFVYACTKKPIKTPGRPGDRHQARAADARVVQGERQAAGGADQGGPGRRRHRRLLVAPRAVQQRLAAGRPRGTLHAVPHRFRVLRAADAVRHEPDSGLRPGDGRGGRGRAMRRRQRARRVLGQADLRPLHPAVRAGVHQLRPAERHARPCTTTAARS